MPAASRPRPTDFVCQTCGPSPATEPARTGDGTVGEEAADEDAEVARSNRLDAKSDRHLATHTPFNPFCQICRDAKNMRKAKPDRKRQKKKSAARSGEVIDVSFGRAELEFGDQCTGDYLLQRRKEISEPVDEEEFSGAKAAAVFYDLGTDELCIEPTACRTTENHYAGGSSVQGSNVRHQVYVL